MKKVMIIGATSAIAEATARLYAGQGAALYLVARNADKLEAVAADLKARGAAEVHTEAMDANAFERHQAIVEAADSALGGLDIALIAHGTLPDQKACEASFELTQAELDTNLMSSVSLLTHLANLLEARGEGTIAVITSVAGDRGRQSNYVYGTAKGALSIFLQGLRNRLFKAGVQVLTIKPGFVDTPMTAEFKKGALWAKPEQIAAGIVRAIEKGRGVVYLPIFWWGIMLIIRNVPEVVFKRLSL